MRNSLRFRITAWYLAFFSLLFAGFGVFLYRVLAAGLETRLDEALISQVDTAAALFEDEFFELHDVTQAAAESATEVKSAGGFIAVLEGRRVISPNAQMVTEELVAAVMRGAPSRVIAIRGAHAATHPVTLSSRNFVVVSYSSLDAIAESLLLVQRVLMFALPALLAIAAFGGYWLATRNLAPLETMAGQARLISSNNLDKRIEIGSAAEELAVLSASFNELLGRLDQSFDSMRRFVADASHELRTPLSVIRGEADVALAANRSPAEYREALTVILDESRRLSALVEDLLNLARADAGRVTLHMEEFYFNDLIADCCRRAQPAAAARGVALECQGSDDVPFRGDEQLLRRLISNLVDNAIRYTPADGRVTLQLEAEAAGVRLRVSDTGIGISPDAAAHVFERFYRADAARGRAGGGFGLGLSIVKWIAESHNGSVALDSKPAAGSTFTVTLPG